MEEVFGSDGPDKMAKDNDCLVEIHTSDMKEPIKYFGTNEQNIKRFYQNNEELIYPIVGLDEENDLTQVIKKD